MQISSDSRVCVCARAVFTQGDKGTTVVAIFLAFSVALHLAEAARQAAASKGSKGGSFA